MTTPLWFDKELYEPYNAGIASVFIVHGDINCLVPNQHVEEEPDKPYVTLRRFFEITFSQRELVIFYDIAAGAIFLTPEMEKKFKQVIGLEENKAGKGADPIAAAAAGLAAKRGLPREPEACLPLIEKALRTMPGVAVVIKSAHFIAPAAGGGAALPPNERANIERLRNLGQSRTIRKNENIVLLLTDQAAKISPELRLTGSEIGTVYIPKPNKDERKAYIVSAIKSAKVGFQIDASLLGKKGKGLDVNVFAHASQGMSLRQISEILLQARGADVPLSLEFVKNKKREMLNSEYGEVMEVLDPERGLEDIGGHEHVKRYFRGVLAAIRKGEYRLVPMGVTLSGPPGTGKTAFVEALAKEAGFNFVKTKNIRSMWVGESEARMEKLIQGLRALAPVVVMNDEADLAEAGRDAPKGDSGVSERLMKAWMELLSDPKIRGQIIVISCTNRPERIDAALMRSGRSDERILLPMPSRDERKAIFPVMFRRHKIASDITDFTEAANATDGLSGADIEMIVLSAFRTATESDKRVTDTASVLEAVRDFIPNARQADIDSMTIAGLRVCSSRRLLPPSINELVTKIVERGLVPNLDDVLADLQARGILEKPKKTDVVTVVPPPEGVN